MQRTPLTEPWRFLTTVLVYLLLFVIYCPWSLITPHATLALEHSEPPSSKSAIGHKREGMFIPLSVRSVQNSTRSINFLWNLNHHYNVCNLWAWSFGCHPIEAFSTKFLENSIERWLNVISSASSELLEASSWFLGAIPTLLLSFLLFITSLFHLCSLSLMSFWSQNLCTLNTTKNTDGKKWFLPLFFLWFQLFTLLCQSA